VAGTLQKIAGPLDGSDQPPAKYYVDKGGNVYLLTTEVAEMLLRFTALPAKPPKRPYSGPMDLDAPARRQRDNIELSYTDP